MYHTSYFKASSDKEVLDFMYAHPFVILCGVGENNKPVATHVPVLIEEREGKLFLLAHIMRKQGHSIAFEHNQQVLAIFSGSHAYVSASWYQNKESASTWNYQAVHANGILKFLGDEKLLEILEKLTDHFENAPHSPSLVSKMDKDYIDKMMQAIIGFEIEVTDIQHVFKLSQNRDAKSYEHIIDQLSNQDEDAKKIAEIMKKNEAAIFGKKEA